MNRYVIDVSIVLKWYLPDEQGVAQSLLLLSDFADGGLNLFAPNLIDYQFMNAMWVAGRMGRIHVDDRDAAVRNFFDIEIHKMDFIQFYDTILVFATKHNMNCYDAAYLSLAELIHAPLVTGDKRLFEAVKDEIPLIRWIEDIGSLP